jgi:hypothetical protein
MYEIDPKTANFDEIDKFASNLLHVLQYPAADREVHLAYFTTQANVILARRASESAARLTDEISEVRRGLINLEGSLSKASTAADAASRSMIRATWALVIGTFLLALATGGLVYFTRALVQAEGIVSSGERP